MKIYSEFGRCVMLAKEAIHFNFLPPYALSKVMKGTLKYSFSVSRCLSLFITYYYSVQGFPYWGRGIAGNPPSYDFFWIPPPPPLPKPMPSHEVPPPRKNEACPSPPSHLENTPHWNMKHPYPLLIPRKSTINNNLKYS